MNSESVEWFLSAHVMWPLATVYYNPPASWPLAIMNTISMIEGIVLVVNLPRLVRFFGDILHGRTPRLSLSSCRKMAWTFGVMAVATALLSTLVYLDYVNDKASLDNSTLRPEVRAAFFTMMLYEHGAAVVLPMTLSLFGLMVWWYPLIYCRSQSRSKLV